MQGGPCSTESSERGGSSEPPNVRILKRKKFYPEQKLTLPSEVILDLITLVS